MGPIGGDEEDDPFEAPFFPFSDGALNGINGSGDALRPLQ